MPALSVLDLAMFVLESRERHFNVGPLIVIDPPGNKRGFADRLLARMMKRPVGPPFNYKLRTPLLGVPSLEVDKDFALSRHVHRVTLAAPGSRRQLFDHVCGLHQRHLDRARPLWELYVIDGLEGGKVALFGKMHHGVIDGRTFVAVVSQWLALSPTDRTVRALWEGVPQRERGGAARRGLLEQVQRALGKAAGSAASAASLYRMLAEQALAAVGFGGGNTMLMPFTGIPKVLQARSSTRRVFDYCMLPLPAMKALGKAHGVSLNDMLLLTLDVALARYLQAIGTQPDKPLVTAMPVGLEGARGGNQIAVLQFPLGAPGLSAAARLKQIRRHTGTIKDVVKREAGGTVMLFTTLVHGVPALLEKLGMKGGIAVSNLVVSNPFGLPEKRYLMGGKVELALPISVVNAGQMLNVTAVTLDDELQIAFLAIPEAVPRLHKLAQYTREAFEAMDAALADVHPPKSGAADGRSPARRSAAPPRATAGTKAAKLINPSRTARP